MNPCPYQSFSVVNVEEEDEFSNPIKSELCTLLMDHFFGSEILIALSSSDSEEMFRSIIRSNLPTIENMKRGYFGESLSTLLVSEFSGYYIPIKKLQFRFTPNQSLTGTDVIGFKLQGNAIVGLCFVESKLRTVRDSGASVLAYKQLMADYDEKQSGLLNFILKNLFRRNDPLFYSLVNYMQPLYSTVGNDEFIVSLIFDNQVWSETNLENLETEVRNTYPRTTVFVGKISGLADLIDGVYEEIGGIDV